MNILKIVDAFAFRYVIMCVFVGLFLTAGLWVGALFGNVHTRSFLALAGLIGIPLSVYPVKLLFGEKPFGIKCFLYITALIVNAMTFAVYMSLNAK